jgi:hypothetical protein
VFSVNLARAAGVGEIAGSDQSFQCACNGAAGEQLLVVLSTAAGLGAVGVGVRSTGDEYHQLTDLDPPAKEGTRGTLISRILPLYSTNMTETS